MGTCGRGINFVPFSIIFWICSVDVVFLFCFFVLFIDLNIVNMLYILKIDKSNRFYTSLYSWFKKVDYWNIIDRFMNLVSVASNDYCGHFFVMYKIMGNRELYSDDC